MRKMFAIGICGIMIGGTMSVMGATSATARSYSTCDKKVTNMEKQAARDYEKGKLSAEDYAKIQAEIALHRELWGC